MVHRTRPELALGVLSLLAWHCGGEKPPAETARDQTTEVLVPASGALTEGEGSRSPTDARIAALADATNSALVEQARVAWGRARDAELRRFAHQQVLRHTDAALSQSRVESELGLTPLESDHSAELEAGGQREVAQLLATDQRLFDSVYVETQLRWHDDALRLFDRELVPNVESAELEASLRAQRALLASQREQLRQLLAPTSF